MSIKTVVSDADGYLDVRSNVQKGQKPRCLPPQRTYDAPGKYFYKGLIL